MDWIKEHPYLTGTIAVLGLIAFFVLRGGGSSAATSGAVASGPSESLQAASMQTAAGIQAAMISANTQVQGLQAQQNMTQLLSSADVEKTRIAASVALQQILSGSNSTDLQTSAALQLGLSQIGAALQLSHYQTPAPPSNITYQISGGYGTQPPVQVPLTLPPASGPEQIPGFNPFYSPPPGIWGDITTSDAREVAYAIAHPELATSLSTLHAAAGSYAKAEFPMCDPNGDHTNCRFLDPLPIAPPPGWSAANWDVVLHGRPGVLMGPAPPNYVG